MPYSLGTVYLEVTPSFDGVQRAMQSELGRGYAKMRQQAERENARAVQSMTKAARDGGSRSGKEYGSAFERELKKHVSNMQSMMRDLPKGNLGSGPDFDKMRVALDRLDKQDLSTAKNRAKAYATWLDLRDQVNTLMRDADRGTRSLSNDTVRNLGALRKEVGRVGKEFDSWGVGAEQVARSTEKIQRALMAAERMAHAENARRDAEERRARQQPARDALNRLRDRAGDLRESVVSLRFDKTEALRDIAAIKTALATALEDANDVELNVDDAKLIQETVRAVNRAVETAEEKIVKLDAQIDEKARAKAMADFKILAKQLSADVKMGVDIDAAAAQAEISAFIMWAQAQLRDDLDVKVRADLKGAIIEAQLLENRLKGVKREAREAGAFMAMLDAGSAANSVRLFNGVLLTFLVLAPLLIPAVAALSGVFMGLALAVSAAFAGIGVLVAGLAGVGGALTALSQLDKARRKAAAGGSKSGVSDARQAVSDARSIEDAERSLERTKRSAAESIAAADERVVEAAKSRRRAVVEAAERELDAVRRVNDAQRALSEAQESVAKRQRDLNDARRQAVRDLEDMNNQLRSASLSEKAAEFAVEEAAVHLNVVLEDDQATQREKDVAQLAYDRAVQQLEEQRLQTRRLEVDTAEANRAGVEGSDRVRRAKEAVSDATERVADAERSVTDARKAADEVAMRNAEQIARAEEALADAREDAAKARRSAAESIADAERTLARAHEDIALRAKEGAKGTNELANEMFNLEEAMRGLTPEGRKFVRFLYSLRPLLAQIRAAAQKGLLPGLQEGLQQIVDVYGPGFVRFVGEMSRVMGDLARDMGIALTSDEWRKFFSEMAKSLPILLDQVGRILGNLATMFAGLMEAFAPFAEDFGDVLVDVTKMWADWATGLKDDPAFAAFMDYLRESGPKLAELFGNIFTIIGKLGEGLAPFADKLLDIALIFTKWLADMEPEDLARMALTIGAVVIAVQALAGVMATVSGVAKLITDVVGLGTAFAGLKGVFAGLPAAARTMATGVGAALAGVSGTALLVIGLVLAAIALIVGTFLYLYNNVEEFKSGVDSFLKEVGENFDRFKREVVQPFAEFFRRAYDMFIKPTFEAFGKIVSDTWDVIKGIFKVFGDTFSRLGNMIGQIIEFIIVPIFGFLGDKISEKWTKYIKPALRLFGDYLEEHVAPKFQAFLDVVTGIWNALLEVLRAPIRLFIEYVINKGLIAGFNWLANKVPGMTPVDPVPIPDALQPGGGKGKPKGGGGGKGLHTARALGGVLPGWSPGRDNLRFYGPNGHVLDLSGGEGIAVPELTKEIGESRLNAANRLARNGNAARGVQMLAGGEIGGPFDWVGDAWDSASGWVSDAASWVGNKAGEAASWVKDAVGTVADFVTNPVGVLEGLAGSAMDKLGLGDSWFADLLSKMVLMPARGLGNWVKGLVTPDTPSGPETSKAMGWQTMWNLVSTAFPSVRLHSAYRPGAITATGYPSMHGAGRAIDITPDMKIFNWLRENFPNSNELIYSPAGAKQLYRGKSHVYGEPTKGMHYNHIHWGFAKGGVVPTLYDKGGDLPPGLSVVANKTRRPEAILTGKLVDDLRRQAQAVTNSSTIDMSGSTFGYDPDEVAARIETRRRDSLAMSGLAGERTVF